jgi:hypothetical protein
MITHLITLVEGSGSDQYRDHEQSLGKVLEDKRNEGD